MSERIGQPSLGVAHDHLTEQIIGAAMDVHRAFGPGLLESAYEVFLCHELGLRGLAFQRQVEVPATYKGITVDTGLRVDVIVERSVIVELKACDAIHPVHEAQLLTYLKLTRLRVGLLMNFNVPVLKQGIKRRVL